VARTGQQQAGDIRADDEQQQSDSTAQQQQRHAHIGDDGFLQRPHAGWVVCCGRLGIEHGGMCGGVLAI
jgi:hypothetical protein